MRTPAFIQNTLNTVSEKYQSGKDLAKKKLWQATKAATFVLLGVTAENTFDLTGKAADFADTSMKNVASYAGATFKGENKTLKNLPQNLSKMFSSSTKAQTDSVAPTQVGSFENRESAEHFKAKHALENLGTFDIQKRHVSGAYLYAVIGNELTCSDAQKILKATNQDDTPCTTLRAMANN